MAKSVTSLKDVLRREEKILEKLKETMAFMVHAESKGLIGSIIERKIDNIKIYKKIIKQSEKCPAVKKNTKGICK